MKCLELSYFFQEDKSEVFAACGDNNIYVWDLESGQQKVISLMYSGSLPNKGYLSVIMSGWLPKIGKKIL